MGTLLGLAGRGFAYLASALGVAIWLLGVTLLIYAALHDSLGGDVGAVDFAKMDLQDLIRVALVTGGAVIALIASVVLLRFTHRIIPFLVCLAFGTLAFIGGATWRNDKTASEPQIAASAPELTPLPEGETGAPAEPPSNDKVAEAAPPPAESAPAAAPPPPAAAAPPPMPPPPMPPPQIEPGAAAPSPEANESRVADALGASAGAVARRSSPPPAGIVAGARPRAAAPSFSGPAAAAARAAEAAKAEAAFDEELRAAELKFNKPEQMQLGTEYVVSAIISLPGTKNLPETLGNVGTPQTRNVAITRKVRVTLTGADFGPGPNGPLSLDAVDTVVITPDSPGQWNWTVKPKREGANLPLIITVYGVDEVNGVAQGVRTLQTYKEVINVNVTPIGQVRLISANFVENWQPVAGALGILGGLWAAIGHFFAGMRRKKEVKEKAA